MAKKKNIKVGTISGLDVLNTDKRKKREKINKNRLDKWL